MALRRFEAFHKKQLLAKFSVIVTATYFVNMCHHGIVTINLAYDLMTILLFIKVYNLGCINNKLYLNIQCLYLNTCASSVSYQQL